MKGKSYCTWTRFYINIWDFGKHVLKPRGRHFLKIGDSQISRVGLLANASCFFNSRMLILTRLWRPTARDCGPCYLVVFTSTRDSGGVINNKYDQVLSPSPLLDTSHTVTHITTIGSHSPKANFCKSSNIEVIIYWCEVVIKKTQSGNIPYIRPVMWPFNRLIKIQMPLTWLSFQVCRTYWMQFKYISMIWCQICIYEMS